TLTQYDAANDPLFKEPWQHVESCVASLEAGISELRGMQKAIERHTRQQLEAATLKENLAVLFDQFAERIGHACYSELVRARLPLRLAEARMRIEELHRDIGILSKMQAEIMRRDPALSPSTAMSRAQVRLEELGTLLEAVPIEDDQGLADVIACLLNAQTKDAHYLVEPAHDSSVRAPDYDEKLT